MRTRRRAPPTLLVALLTLAVGAPAPAQPRPRSVTLGILRPGAGPGDHERTITYGGVQRRYEVHVPGGSDGRTSLPVVINLHGGGGNAPAARRSTGMDRLADLERFLVVYPEGVGRLRRVGLTFNAGLCCAYAMLTRSDDVGFVRTILDELGRFVPVDRRRVYATGLSNGGMMAYRLACELPDRFAAVASVAGTLGLSRCRPSRPVPVMHVHGTADRNLPYDGGFGPRSIARVMFASVPETIAAWRRINRSRPGPPATDGQGPATIERYDPLPGGAPIVLVRVEGGGHVWPGGDPILPRWIVGEDAGGLDASRLIWDFFRRHALPPDRRGGGGPR